MRLAINTRAPDFKTADMFGQPVDLQCLAGKPMLISFLRNGGCAMCNVQVHKLIQRYDSWHQQGLEVIVIFESPVQSLLQNVSRQDAPFAIIPDPTAQLYALYGVESSEDKISHHLTPKQQQLVDEAHTIGYELKPEAGSNFFRLPADFLIDADQVIREAFYSEAVGDHLSFDLIDSFLARQNTPHNRR